MLNFYGFSAEYTRGIEAVYRSALRYFGQRDVFETEVTSVSKDDMRKINLETRGVDSVTDVLSYPNLTDIEFPIRKSRYKTDINAETGRLILGEIVLCFGRIEEQAKEYGHGIDREYRYLFLHGLLHLFGFDHEEESDKAAMRRAEEEILAGTIKKTPSRR